MEIDARRFLVLTITNFDVFRLVSNGVVKIKQSPQNQTGFVAIIVGFYTQKSRIHIIFAYNLSIHPIGINLFVSVFE